MQIKNINSIAVEHHSIDSVFLQRNVKIDFYFPRDLNQNQPLNLLLINDGQDLKKMGYVEILEEFMNQESKPAALISAGIHCAHDRKMEYGVAGVPDFKGRGVNAGLFTRFVIGELIPLLRSMFENEINVSAFAGFSLGGLMAFDITWKHPEFFQKVGVFSGSFWWRSVDQNEEEYDDHKHRIMHRLVKKSEYKPGLKFFFQTGNMDETRDRNKNGIIDSIDDTLDLIHELVNKGYDKEKDIFYLELPDGRHDVATWGKAMPEFLKWAFS